MKTFKLRAIVALLFAYVFFSCVTIYASQCGTVLNNANNPLTDPTHDSSVEAEVTFTPVVANILTTSDGTVGALFIDEYGFEIPIPLWFKTYALINHPIQKLRKILWDDIDFTVKSKLLFKLNSDKQLSIFNRKTVVNLKVKKNIEVNIEKPITLFGKKLKPGLQKLDLDMLQPQVEIERTIGKLRNHRILLELHIRTGKKASTNSADTWKLMNLLGIVLPYQHVHIVGPKPKMTVQNIYSLTYYYSAVNLLVELVNIYFNYGHTASYKEINYLGAGRLYHEINNTLKTGHIDSLKKGYIGKNGESFYDQKKVWGLEHRLLTDLNNQKVNNNVLDIIQTSMLTQSYLPETYLGKNYINTIIKPQVKANKENYLRKNEKISRALSNSFVYNYNLENINRKKRIQLFDLLYTSFHNSGSNQHIELRMLFFNWATHPLFFNSKSKIKKIEAAQIVAIDTLIKYYQGVVYDKDSQTQKNYINDTMRAFIKSSGLLNNLLKSLGSSLSDLESTD